ncbi:LecA/PA-IL family lectin [Chelativorans salis]|uniref:LecA/PA-IL family lectin n=1 Tax=Chelativorans salis TaxID=2978478 RepID=A0ABT2LU97_9HYPH|nr:LecA/PA-IL family lectin [Chelativorans sp. EGI FJ00035]MCT7377956.1 LecA/PA-IL family lectin [Chelativorans sp. EGI FJ00035]
MWHGKLDPKSENGKATSVHLKEDDVITITVTGSARNGPAAPEEGPDGDPQNKDPKAILPGTNVGAVLMRVGKDGAPKVIGTGKSNWGVGEVGEITFLYNDVPGEYGNNSGSFDVTVTRETPKPVTCTLEATAEKGVKSGVTVSSGDKISITVTGKASYGPSYPEFDPDGDPQNQDPGALLPGTNVGACLMRIGSGPNPYRPVGKGLSDYHVQEEGEIAFFYNDDPGEYGNNRGSFEITLTKK